MSVKDRLSDVLKLACSATGQIAGSASRRKLTLAQVDNWILAFEQSLGILEQLRKELNDDHTCNGGHALDK